MKTVLFVPGGMEYYNTRNYAKVLSTIRKKGYRAVFVPINWKRTVLSGQVEQLNLIYEKYDPKNTILAGFSWGAMTALVAASMRPPKELWLFSLSPHFKEDVETMPKWVHKLFGKHRLKVFRETSFNVLAKKISSKTLVLMGEAEAKKYPQLDKRDKDAIKRIKNSRLVIVPKAPHDVTHKNYLDEIAKNI